MLTDLHKDNTHILPRRYERALTSLKANKNIKIMVSDKGKQTIVCYTTTYTFLMEAHFSDRDVYQPVDDSDLAGRDLNTMKEELFKN